MYIICIYIYIYIYVFAIVQLNWRSNFNKDTCFIMFRWRTPETLARGLHFEENGGRTHLTSSSWEANPNHRDLVAISFVTCKVNVQI